MMVEEGPSSSIFQRQRQPQTFPNVHPDLGNVTIEHVQDTGNEHMQMLLVEQQSHIGAFPDAFMEDDVLDIGMLADGYPSDLLNCLFII